MADYIYLVYNNVKKKIDSPVNYEELLTLFKQNFNDSSTEGKYEFKTKDGIEVNEDVDIDFFKEGMEIEVTKKEKKIENFSIFTSQVHFGKKNQEEKKEEKKQEQEEQKEEIIIVEEKDLSKSKEDLEKEYNYYTNENNKKTKELNEIKNKNEGLKEELEKLKKELEKNNMKSKKEKINLTDLELALAELQKKYENEKNQLNENIEAIKQSNKNLENELEELRLGNEEENEKNEKLNNEQSELITRKNNMISQAFNKESPINKTSKPNFNIKKEKSKNKNALILNYIKKTFEEKKKNKSEKEKKYIEEKEKKRKNTVIEKFKAKLSQIKKSNINIEMNENKDKNGKELEENNELKQKKSQLIEEFKNLQNEKEQLNIKNKEEITKLTNDLKLRKKEKKERQKKEEEEKKRLEDEEKKRIEDKEKQRKEEEEKQRKELEEKQRKELEEKQRKEELDRQRKEKEKKQNDLKNQNVNKNKIEIEKVPIDEENYQELLRKGKGSLRNQNIRYSYECTNLLNLNQYIYEGTESADIPIILKNTGSYTWPPRQTKLIFDKNSKLKGKDVELDSLDKNQEKKFYVKIVGLSKLPPGEYETGVYLNIKGGNIGKLLKMKVVIIKNNIDPIEKHMGKVNQFRNEFGLPQKDFSDDELYDVLLSNDFIFEKAFACLFDN